MADEEQPASQPDPEAWPYDPSWVELAAPPLERLRRGAAEATSRDAARYPAAPVNRPTIAP